MEETVNFNLDPQAIQGFGGGLAGGTFATFIIGYLVFFTILAIASYVAFSLAIWVLGGRLGVKNRWLAWVPLVQSILVFQMGGFSGWWALLVIGTFIPFLNFLFAIGLMVLMVLSWMKIAQKVGKPNWLGILIIIPIANLVVPLYLAFSKSDAVAVPNQPNPVV